MRRVISTTILPVCLALATGQYAVAHISCATNSNAGDMMQETIQKPRELLAKKSFFGRGNCLKVMFNSAGEFYLHLGKESKQGWQWSKLKLSDMELGDILLVIKGVKESTSFFHKFNNSSQQLWVNRKDALFFKAGDVNKQLSFAEAEVLRVIIEGFLLVSAKLEARPQ